MSKTLKEWPITTANARSKLGPGEYGRRLDADSAIFYRKSDRCTWFARWRNWGRGATYLQNTFGPANDLNDKPIDGLFTFLQAEKRAREIVAEARKEAQALAAGPIITVRDAVDAYAAKRDATEIKRQRNITSAASYRLKKHLLGRPGRGKRPAIPAAPLADVPLYALREGDLSVWRASLKGIKATSVNRLVNDLRAALNGSYMANRHRLPSELPSIIKHGLKAEEIDDDEAVPVARENQILADAQVGLLINAARELDGEQEWEGDLFRFVVVLAATGARFSQIARMKVGDAQRAHGRLMVPASRKGKGKSGHIAVPVGKDVLDALQPVVTGRKSDEPLLMRRQLRQMPGSIEWHRAGRRPWALAKDLGRPWGEIRQRAGLPDVVPYAFRHSSIVRGIRANLPLRLVASLHDTSTEMIEKHYAKYIVDGLEELASRAVVPLVPAGDDNVIPLSKSAKR
ncbi:MAG: tyrosine-type recombinase/integrase [Parvibaculaceae bacterium]